MRRLRDGDQIEHVEVIPSPRGFTSRARARFVDGADLEVVPPRAVESDVANAQLEGFAAAVAAYRSEVRSRALAMALRARIAATLV
jgi:hypothetical protein